MSDDGVIGDGVEAIGPDHPDYAEWAAEAARLDAIFGRTTPQPHAPTEAA